MVPMALGGKLVHSAIGEIIQTLSTERYAWPPGDDAEFAMNVLLRTMYVRVLKSSLS